MRKAQQQSYSLDNSAVIHLAAMNKKHTNSFRITLVLTEEILPQILQAALDRIVARFPTIAAGIRDGFFRHKVVPVDSAPKVMPDTACLAPMTNQEIHNCAFRILYRDRRIVGEFFHSLTDGYGGMVFLKTLLAEYLKQVHDISPGEDSMMLNVSDLPQSEELADDYFTYAGSKKATLKQRHSYQLPGKPTKDAVIQTTTRTYDLQVLLDLAHYYDVSLTTLLVSVMLESVAEIQKKHSATGQSEKMIRIMVPVNLRKLFPSKTLRNFSLYALPCVQPHECKSHFKSLVTLVHKQLHEQVTNEYMSKIMAAHTSLEKCSLVKMTPWFLKHLVLKIGHRLFGEQNSCISLSNLGSITFQKETAPFIESVEVTLTPRISSPYNCGVVSYGNKCAITFSRLCPDPELEMHFFGKLEHIFERNGGTPICPY